jgi:hypothetical protein
MDTPAKPTDVTLTVDWLPIDSIVANPANPRQITELSFDKLVKSLRECPALFTARPVLASERADGSRVIVGGDKRWRAAKRLGWAQVPVILFRHLTDDQEREIIIKDNGEFGEWDWDLLANGFDGLPLDDWGIKLPESWLTPPDSKDALPKLEVEPPESDAIGNYAIILFETRTEYDEFLQRLGLKPGTRSIPWTEYRQFLEPLPKMAL